MEKEFVVMIASPTLIVNDDVVVCADCHKVIERGEGAFKLFFPKNSFEHLCDSCRTEYS